jgi:hypothetical protein
MSSWKTTWITPNDEELSTQIITVKEVKVKQCLNIEAIYYDSISHLFILTFVNKTIITFSPDIIPEFKGASNMELSDVWFDNFGESIQWDLLNFDIHTEDLVKFVIKNNIK